METLKSIWVSMTILGLLLGVGADLSGEEASRDIIDKTNWEKAEGLVPDCLLSWLKEGDFVLNVGELNYNPAEYFVDYFIESLKTNSDKYDLNEEDEIVEVSTSKAPQYVVGLPFPRIDPKDPKAAIKIMYNKNYVDYCAGMKKFQVNIAWIGRSGFEREVSALYHAAPLTGLIEAKDLSNKRRIEIYSLISVRQPYDLAGTAQMLWRFQSKEQDENFAYVPAIRRVRRLSPANRSDGFLGSDLTVDDLLAYNGKIPDFEWKLLGQQDVLAAFQSRDPVEVVETNQEELKMSTDLDATRIGYQEQGWQGAPWCPLDLAFSKRPAWVIEAKPKNPYYNYGVQKIWIDRETGGPLYKIMSDRSNEFWKFALVATTGWQTADKRHKFLAWTDHLIVDEKRDHASYIRIFDPRSQMIFFAKLDLNDFSLAGFQKYCK